MVRGRPIGFGAGSNGAIGAVASLVTGIATAIRRLPNLAGGSGEENELPAFFSLAATNSAAVIRAFLAAME